MIIVDDDDDIVTQADKKAHHNALERKRRDHIKESFTKLRDSIPETKKEKTSRALILKRATDYIKLMSQRNQTRQKEIEKMKRQNQILRQQGCCCCCCFCCSCCCSFCCCCYNCCLT
ncbi:hypothetical protein HELRODRAFT_85565 [Helobdella robusta]|uniref:Protein max n=1 Tax=Helobdella robusta TaxID=6412 RepID=T1G5Z5_HELRO|nr:hypothetical protein HELRODRAFT_85565 [Helobdella robusta]ESN97323.1 hypothetical protein HELRODRAFT_85565 [Helobdella robusta]